MTADDDSCSSYDSVSSTDLTVDTTKSATDIVTSNYDLAKTKQNSTDNYK